MKYLEPYPFNCDIYRKEIDLNAKPTERKEVSELIVSTKCDIKFSQTMSDFKSTIVYEVFIPLAMEEGVMQIKSGDYFIGTMLDIAIEGEIFGISISMLNACSFFVQTKSLNG